MIDFGWPKIPDPVSQHYKLNRHNFYFNLAFIWNLTEPLIYKWKALLGFVFVVTKETQLSNFEKWWQILKYLNIRLDQPELGFYL